jgi:hypothetical protein
MTTSYVSRSNRTAVCVVEPKHDDRANDGYEHTVEIEAGEPGRDDGCEEVPADHGADDPEGRGQAASLDLSF